MFAIVIFDTLLHVPSYSLGGQSYDSHELMNNGLEGWLEARTAEAGGFLLDLEASYCV